MKWKAKSKITCQSFRIDAISDDCNLPSNKEIKKGERLRYLHRNPSAPPPPKKKKDIKKDKNADIMTNRYVHKPRRQHSRMGRNE